MTFACFCAAAPAVTKISSYNRVINVPNSVTVLHDMLPVSLAMMERKTTGMFNFTNPGVVSHNEVLAAYKKEIDPDFWYANFSEEEQSKVRWLCLCVCVWLTSRPAWCADCECAVYCECARDVGILSADSLKHLITLFFDFILLRGCAPAQVLKAGRCNNHLDVSKLQAAVPDMVIPDARSAMVGVFQRMKADMQKAGTFPPGPRKGPKPTDVETH